MSKYEPLVGLLRSCSEDELTLFFSEIDDLVGGLPRSARTYPAWWANSRTDDTHTWAHLWVSAGWEVRALDLDEERVTFSRASVGPIPPSFWWVNHKQTHRVELSDGYIWSPRNKRNGARNQAYSNLTLVRPGDVVISYADTLIKAIGVATAAYSDSPKPGDYGIAGDAWDNVGWRVPVDWSLLQEPLKPKDHIAQIAPLLPQKHSPLQKAGDGNQGVYLASISSSLGKLILQLAGRGTPGLSQLLQNSSARKSKTALRLPVEELRKITALDIWNAVQDLLAGEVVPGFGASTDYDLIAGEGIRLPPKAVFGLAATRALGFDVEPKHFTAGLETPCFEALQEAGFLIVPKDSEAPPAEPTVSYEDQLWSEGRPRLVTHLRRERAPGLSRAKREAFRLANGRLYCERCGMDPVEKYGSPLGEACIEVHHNNVHVSDMKDGQLTGLDDLQCLCASCHRVVHRELKAST